MPFFLFLYLRSKEKERAAKKEKENTQMFPTLSHMFERGMCHCERSEAIQPFRLRRISFSGYCASHTPEVQGRSYFNRERVTLVTIASERVRACPQQPFNPMPAGHCGYQFHLRVFSFFGYISFSFRCNKRERNVQINKNRSSLFYWYFRPYILCIDR